MTAATKLAPVKERPILFSGPMVRAILEGRKTQTRRVVKPQPPRPEDVMRVCGTDFHLFTDRHVPSAFRVAGPVSVVRGLCGQSEWKCPYGQPGERLLVAMEIPESPNRDYCAGSDGQIYSRTRYAGFGRKERTDWYPLVGHETGKGYRSVSLCHENKKVTRAIHRLVCSAFYGPAPFLGAQVRHLDGNPENNEPSNLAWGSQEDNWRDRKAQGRGCEGEKHHAAKLSDAERAHVRWAVQQGLCSQKHAARMLGLSQSAVGQLLTGAELRHPEPVVPEFRVPRLTLEVTEVRVQRLQDISEEDARAEGAFFTDYGRRCHHPWDGPGPCPAPEGHHPLKSGWSMAATTSDEQCLGSAQMAFANLWESIHGPGSWGANPWVWAVSFRRVTP